MSALSSEPAIHIQGLRKFYGRSAALDGVNLTVAQGESWALLGPNGSGKTTLLRIIATLVAPSEGCAAVFGAPVTEPAPRARRHIGYAPQTPTADHELTCTENLHFTARLYGMGRVSRRERIEELLEFFQLTESRDRQVGQLSGGMKRRVELARALIHQPWLLLLDEPSSGLDPGARESFWALLHRLRRELGLTLLMATHRIDDAEGACDSVAVLRRGRIAVTARLDGSVRLGEIYSSGEADL